MLFQILNIYQNISYYKEEKYYMAILFIIASRATDNQLTSALVSPNKIGPYCKPSSS
jgi:hypothetical protein